MYSATSSDNLRWCYVGLKRRIEIEMGLKQVKLTREFQDEFWNSNIETDYSHGFASREFQVSKYANNKESSGCSPGATVRSSPRSSPIATSWSMSRLLQLGFTGLLSQGANFLWQIFASGGAVLFETRRFGKKIPSPARSGNIKPYRAKPMAPSGTFRKRYINSDNEISSYEIDFYASEMMPVSFTPRSLSLSSISSEESFYIVEVPQPRRSYLAQLKDIYEDIHECLPSARTVLVIFPLVLSFVTP